MPNGVMAILPEEWKYGVPKDKKKQLDLLCRLMKDKRVDSLVCGTDTGCEGELIFRLVYQYAGCSTLDFQYGECGNPGRL